MTMSATTSNHAGLLIPLEMFRISQLAALLAEQLVGKARNILDAKLTLTRHPDAPILLVRIEGHVVGGDPAAFWRENADLAALASRMFPRQVILYYAEPGPAAERREGFVVTQHGQALAADDATADRMPPDATDLDWPVARLCQQLRVSMQELADGFPGGPRVEVKLVEPRVDDQALLMTLVGRDPADDDGAAPPAPAAGRAPGAPGAPGAPPKAAPPGAAGARAAVSKRANLEEDAKRRAKQQATQEAELARRAAEIGANLPFETDEHGIIVAPRAELSEPDILRPYIHAKLEGDLPSGLPKTLEGEYQGRRVDIVVRVEFLSEVFVENNPLTRATFESRAHSVEFGERKLLAIEVLGPRLGYGTLVSTGKRHVFVSRKLELPLPSRLVLDLLDG